MKIQREVCLWGKIYYKSSNSMMTPDFLVLVLTPRIWGGESILSLKVSCRFLSLFYHVFSVAWLQPDSFHEEYDSLGNL